MRDDSPLGLLWVRERTTCVSEKLYKNPFSLEKSRWDGLQKINVKISNEYKIKGLSWYITEIKGSKMATGEDGGL